MKPTSWSPFPFHQSIPQSETQEPKNSCCLGENMGRETILHYALCILHLNYSRPMPFQQRTNTSWRSTRSQPAVSRRLFRCLGAHLLQSPSIVKSLIVSALVLATGGHTTPAERDRSVSPNSVSRPTTSFRCPFFSTHSFDPFGSLINRYV